MQQPPFNKHDGAEGTWWRSPTPVCSAVVNKEKPALSSRAASQFLQATEPFHALEISWCRYRKLHQGHVCERQGTGGKTLLAWEKGRLICITSDRRSVWTARMKSGKFRYVCPQGLPCTVVSYSGDANPTLLSHKIPRPHEELPGQNPSKAEHSSAVPVPSAAENLPSPLPTSCCPFNISEKPSQPFQETLHTSITRCAK